MWGVEQREIDVEQDDDAYVRILNEIFGLYGTITDSALRVKDERGLKAFKKKSVDVGRRCEELFLSLKGYNVPSDEERQRLWRTQLERQFVFNDRKNFAVIQHLASFPRDFAERIEEATIPFVEAMEKNKKLYDQHVDLALRKAARARLEEERNKENSPK